MAGSFVVSSLGHVFRQRRFDSLAPLAVLVSLALLVTAPLTVLSDARQPHVALTEIFARDHLPNSPLSMFIVVWLTYVALMIAELYFTFRVPNARLAATAGPGARFHRLLTLGRPDRSEAAAARDRRVLVYLSTFGIVLAFLFHGYIGFVFGATKARPLWATPLMPVLFSVSAMVSGIALMWLVYVLAEAFHHRAVALDRMYGPATWVPTEWTQDPGLRWPVQEGYQDLLHAARSFGHLPDRAESAGPGGSSGRRIQLVACPADTIRRLYRHRFQGLVSGEADDALAGAADVGAHGAHVGLHAPSPVVGPPHVG